MSKFEYEERYLVLKHKDINKLDETKQKEFFAKLNELVALLPDPEGGPREYLVLESDWPEFDPAWASIKARVEANG